MTYLTRGIGHPLTILGLAESEGLKCEHLKVGLKASLSRSSFSIKALAMHIIVQWTMLCI